MATDEPKETGKALELVPKGQRGLMQQASDIGALVVKNGAPFLDLSQPAILERFNVLAPSMVIQQVSPNFTPYVNVVQFKATDPGVYPIDKKWNGRTQTEEILSVGLGKVQLMSLASAMGAEIKSRAWVDNYGNRYAEAQFIVRKPDGTAEAWPGNRAWIKEDEYEKLVDSCPATKWEGAGQNRRERDLTEAERERWIRTNWIRVKEHALGMVETKAIERAIRAGGKVPTKLPVAALEKPFAVLAVAYTPDANNVQVQLALVDKGRTAIETLYGTETTTILHQPVIDDEEPLAAPSFTDPRTGVKVDPVTGVVEGEAVEEAELVPEGPFGDKPKDDREIPTGDLKGKLLSDLARNDAAYVNGVIVPSIDGEGKRTGWSLLAEQWLVYWHGEKYSTDAPADLGDDRVNF
jgi:hypothetical protein